jgi:hypothetical protein
MLGLAAGYIKFEDCDSEGLSGWRLDHDYFVTCAHFLQLRKRVQDGTLAQNLWRLSQAEPVSAWISHIGDVNKGTEVPPRQFPYYFELNLVQGTVRRSPHICAVGMPSTISQSFNTRGQNRATKSLPSFSLNSLKQRHS